MVKNLSIVPEDNIVSEEEYFVENEDESIDDDSEETRNTKKCATFVDEDVIIADIDDDSGQADPIECSRPRRANAGTGVERLQMDFHGKGYGAK